jgi:hypothetical protein
MVDIISTSKEPIGSTRKKKDLLDPTESDPTAQHESNSSYITPFCHKYESKDTTLLNT